MTVAAVRWHGVRDLRLDALPDPPDAGPGEVRLRVLAGGICGTDIEKLHHGGDTVPSRRDPATGNFLATVIGHEFTGLVEFLGPGVAGLRVGDLVAADTLLSCGRCSQCAQGSPNRCEELVILGLNADGGMTPLCTVPARTLVRVPDGVGADAAVLAETLAVAVRALRRAGLATPTIGSSRPGVEEVSVVGGGAVGLLAAQAARAFGARAVTVVEPRADRRDLARELGVDEATTPAGCRPRSAEVVLECTGNPAAVATALTIARTGGVVVVVGVHPGTVPVELHDVVERELTVRGSFSHRIDTDFTDALELLGQGRVLAEPLIGLRVGLDEAIARGFSAAAAGDAVKVVIHPGR